jgi:hypothetical protein
MEGAGLPIACLLIRTPEGRRDFGGAHSALRGPSPLLQNEDEPR